MYLSYLTGCFPHYDTRSAELKKNYLFSIDSINPGFFSRFLSDEFKYKERHMHRHVFAGQHTQNKQ